VGVRDSRTQAGITVLSAIARLLVAVLAGLALSLAFPPRSLGWLAPLAVAAFTLACWRRGAGGGAFLGLVFGFAFFLPLISWMKVVGDDAWILLSLLCASWMALTGALIALVTRLPLWPLWVATAWPAAEALRVRIPWGGFAWGRLAFSQADTPLAFLATIGGAPLVSFAVALAGTLIAGGVLALAPKIVGSPRWGSSFTRSTGRATAYALSVVALVLAGLAVSGSAVLPQAGNESQVTAAVVQGNVPRAGLGFQGSPRQVLDNHVRVTEALAADVRAGIKAQPDFVIWPENSSDVDPLATPAIATDIQRAVDDIGVPVLVGAVVANPYDADTVLNVGIVWKPGSGAGDAYAKRHPVPFGEYIPFRSILSRFIDRFALIPKDFAAGSVPGVLTLGPARVGDVICFEIADDEVVRDAIVNGGQLLVVQTNNATYGRTGQPEQQLAITRLRAIEHARTTMVAATSGISAMVSARGEVTDSLPEFVPGSLVATVTQTDALTLSDRLGATPERIIAAVALLGAVLALLTRRLGSEGGGRRRRRVAQEDDTRE